MVAMPAFVLFAEGRRRERGREASFGCYRADWGGMFGGGVGGNAKALGGAFAYELNGPDSWM